MRRSYGGSCSRERHNMQILWEGRRALELGAGLGLHNTNTVVVVAAAVAVVILAGDVYTQHKTTWF